MALGSTQPLVKMGTRNVSWGYRRPVREADNLTTLMRRMSWKSGSLNLLEPSGPHRACYGTAFYSFLLEAESTPGRLEGLCHLIILMTPSGIEPATFGLVAPRRSIWGSRSSKILVSRLLFLVFPASVLRHSLWYFSIRESATWVQHCWS